MTNGRAEDAAPSSTSVVEKGQLFVLFSGGIFVMAAGILHCVLIVTVRRSGQLSTLGRLLKPLLITVGRRKWRFQGR